MAEKILVAMSGGVDSAVSALLLLEAGYDVSAVTFLVTDGSEATAEDARRVADKLSIGHHIVDYRREFKEDVTDFFAESYKRGLTPNPCVRCNNRIKFGRLLDFASERGYPRLATGHYAKNEPDEKSGRPLLKMGEDSTKDQSYFLYTLTERVLSRVIFPLGTYDKKTVREIAQRYGLVGAEKPESQDICFIADDYRDFLADYLNGRAGEPGDFVDVSGKILGRHKGIFAYTVGQRKGMGVSSDAPLYVIGKNAEKNQVVLGREQELYSDSLTAAEVTTVSGAGFDEEAIYDAKIRYSRHMAKVRVYHTECNVIVLEFMTPQRAAAPGQSVVIYSGDTVIGGGIIR